MTRDTYAVVVQPSNLVLSFSLARFTSLVRYVASVAFKLMTCDMNTTILSWCFLGSKVSTTYQWPWLHCRQTYQGALILIKSSVVTMYPPVLLLQSSQLVFYHPHVAVWKVTFEWLHWALPKNVLYLPVV
jgi:hypothetical protein